MESPAGGQAGLLCGSIKRRYAGERAGENQLFPGGDDDLLGFALPAHQAGHPAGPGQAFGFALRQERGRVGLAKGFMLPGTQTAF